MNKNGGIHCRRPGKSAWRRERYMDYVETVVRFHHFPLNRAKGWRSVYSHSFNSQEAQTAVPRTPYHHIIIITMNVLFTKTQFAGTRCYHFDAREDVKGDPYLQIVEVPTGGGKGKRHRIFIHARDLEAFKASVVEAIDQCLEQFGANVTKS